MSLGMDKTTGRWLSDIAHLKQSIQIILTTRIGTRTERRHFGSLVPSIVDYPLQQKYILMLYASVATALAKHEPRLQLERLSSNVIQTKENPTIEIAITGFLKGDFDSTRPIHLTVPL